MAGKQKITFYCFYSGMRSFLSKLLKSPIGVDIPDFMKKNGFTSKKIINDLMSKDILERHERILDKTNSDKEVPTYSVKYKVKKKNFERKMHRLYSLYFENDNKNKINECDCSGSGVDGGGEGLFSDMGGEPMNGDEQRGGYDNKMATVLTRGSIYSPKKKLKESRRVHLTESQVRYLNEFFNTENAGDSMLQEDGEGAGATNASISQDGPIAPLGKNKHPGFVDKGDGFFDSACSRGGNITEMTKYDFFKILNK